MAGLRAFYSKRQVTCFNATVCRSVIYYLLFCCCFGCCLSLHINWFDIDMILKHVTWPLCISMKLPHAVYDTHLIVSCCLHFIFSSLCWLFFGYFNSFVRSFAWQQTKITESTQLMAKFIELMHFKWRIVHFFDIYCQSISENTFFEPFESGNFTDCKLSRKYTQNLQIISQYTFEAILWNFSFILISPEITIFHNHSYVYNIFLCYSCDVWLLVYCVYFHFFYLLLLLFIIVVFVRSSFVCHRLSIVLPLNELICNFTFFFMRLNLWKEHSIQSSNS